VISIICQRRRTSAYDEFLVLYFQFLAGIGSWMVIGAGRISDYFCWNKAEANCMWVGGCLSIVFVSNLGDICLYDCESIE
jgi:hypothetical protein